MAKFCHFDLTASDIARARKFYETAFGWVFQSVPAPMEYWLIHTGDAKYGIDGGLSVRQPGDTSNMTFTARVPDVDAYMERAISAGATIHHQKHRIPGVGDFAGVVDPEGLPFGMMQFLPGSENHVVPGAAPDGNRPVHFEFMTDDPAAATRFYSAVLDWSFKKHGGEHEYYLIEGGSGDPPDINGGMMPRVPDVPKMYTAILETPNLDATTAKIVAAGGHAVTDRMEIPNVGSCAYFHDTEKNALGVMQFLPRTG